MGVTAEDIERFTVRQDANNFLRELRRLDQSTPRGPNEPSRVERLREAVAKQMGIELPGNDDMPAKEVVTSKSSASLVVQKDRISRETKIQIDGAPELQLLMNRTLYAKTADNEYVPVMRIE